MRKLTIRKLWYSYTNKIVYRKGTRGTETSKYPEEKKVKTISQVVASEREAAQTIGRNIDGVRTHDKQEGYIVEAFGKTHQSG